jgi:hypothetical protein
MTTRYDVTEVATVNSQPKFRVQAVDDATGAITDCCPHEHESEQAALDCTIGRQARGLDPLLPTPPAPAPAGLEPQVQQA